MPDLVIDLRKLGISFDWPNIIVGLAILIGVAAIAFAIAAAAFRRERILLKR